MSFPHPAAVEDLLARWETRNPGSPVRAVVQRAADLGFTVVPPGGSGTARYLRLVLDAPAGRAVTLYVDALRLTAGAAALRAAAAALPGAVVRARDVQLPFDGTDPLAVLEAFHRTATGEQITPAVDAPDPAPVGQETSQVQLAPTSPVPPSSSPVPDVLPKEGAGVRRRIVLALVAAIALLAVVGGVTAPAPVPAATSTPATASVPPADGPEAVTVAAEATLLRSETDEAATTRTAVSGTTGLLPDAAVDAAVETAGPTTALAALAAVPVQGRAPRTGYDRDLFGAGWVDVDRNGCDTRNDMLARDLTAETFKPGTRNCVVLTGSLADPYSGTTIAFLRGRTTSDDVHIDHVVALSNSWQTGSQGWDAATRTAFANDPLNLLAVDGPLNMQKGDGDAATWLPPNRSYRCAYVARQVAVKVTYGLWMTQAERNAVATVLSSCPDEPLPGGVVAKVPARTAAAVTTAVPAPRSTAAAPRPEPAPAVAVPAPLPAPEVVPEPEGPYYKNCDAVRAAGAAPIHSADPGWQPKFDRDGDGVGCEN